MGICIDQKLHIISVVSNPVRYKSRYELFRRYCQKIEQQGVNHIVVELATGDRPFYVTSWDNKNHLQLRSFEELWHKENMINCGIVHLSTICPDWEYMAWVDADIEFTRPDWVMETIHQLQHYMFIQMFHTAVDLGPNGETIATHKSFMRQYLTGQPYKYGNKGKGYENWHPGYCWAARREAIDHVGGLIDTSILGAGDNHMAHALIGRLDGTFVNGLNPNYKKHLYLWQERCDRFIRRDVGFMDGTILHYWHGKKADRRYHDRWKILTNHKYDPEIDLKKDSYNLWQLNDRGDLRSMKLRDDIRQYFRARNEDSIDIV